MTVPVVLAISGGLLLFIGIIGGGVNMLGKLNVPQIGTSMRVLSGLFGLALIGVSVWLFLSQASAEKGVAEVKKGKQQTAKYGFESGTMGWMAQDYIDSRACVEKAIGGNWGQEAIGVGGNWGQTLEAIGVKP